MVSSRYLNFSQYTRDSPVAKKLTHSTLITGGDSSDSGPLSPHEFRMDNSGLTPGEVPPQHWESLASNAEHVSGSPHNRGGRDRTTTRVVFSPSQPGTGEQSAGVSRGIATQQQYANYYGANVPRFDYQPDRYMPFYSNPVPAGVLGGRGHQLDYATMPHNFMADPQIPLPAGPSGGYPTFGNTNFLPPSFIPNYAPDMTTSKDIYKDRYPLNSVQPVPGGYLPSRDNRILDLVVTDFSAMVIVATFMASVSISMLSLGHTVFDGSLASQNTTLNRTLHVILQIFASLSLSFNLSVAILSGSAASSQSKRLLADIRAAPYTDNLKPKLQICTVMQSYGLISLTVATACLFGLVLNSPYALIMIVPVAGVIFYDSVHGSRMSGHGTFGAA
ncbi:hypothetical protein CPC08DRAFT_768424 [Agrocybe pediades]|nr:hypothetical protein CPC08DRAFT_768424 [Agrocybe pediades]